MATPVFQNQASVFEHSVQVQSDLRVVHSRHAAVSQLQFPEIRTAAIITAATTRRSSPGSARPSSTRATNWQAPLPWLG